MELNEELLKKAAKAKSAEELRSLAMENGMELTDAEAAGYFAEIHKEGELSDEELDGVAGGGCHRKDGRLVVTVMHNCDLFTCKQCGKTGVHWHSSSRSNQYPRCDDCKYCTYESGLWLCNNPGNRK